MILAEQTHIPYSGLEKYLIAVEMVYSSREEYTFNITVCQQKSKRISVILQQQNLSWEESKGILKKASKIYLSITGKGIIHKKTAHFYEKSQELCSVLLPDAKSADFCAQSYDFYDQYFGAIIRTETLEQAIQPFVDAKLFPANIYIGPYSGLIIAEIIGELDLHVQCSGYALHFVNMKLESFEQIQGEATLHQVNDETINGVNMHGLSTVISTETDAIAVSAIENKKAQSCMEEARQKRRFNIFLNSIVVFILLTVSINYYFNQQLADEYSKLDEELALNKQSISDIEKLEREIEEKKTLVGKRSANFGPVISVMADQIATHIPASIRLTNMEIFPLAGKIQKEKAVMFSYTKIIVEGVANETDALDKWIHTCKEEKWIKDVLIVKYDFDNNQNKGLFKLEFLL